MNCPVAMDEFDNDNYALTQSEVQLLRERGRVEELEKNEQIRSLKARNDTMEKKLVEDTKKFERLPKLHPNYEREMPKLEAELAHLVVVRDRAKMGEKSSQMIVYNFYLSDYVIFSIEYALADKCFSSAVSRKCRVEDQVHQIADKLEVKKLALDGIQRKFIDFVKNSKDPNCVELAMLIKRHTELLARGNDIVSHLICCQLRRSSTLEKQLKATGTTVTPEQEEAVRQKCFHLDKENQKVLIDIQEMEKAVGGCGSTE